MMIIGKTYDEERALYAMQDSSVEKCRFAGPADGESALKETRNIIVSDCDFELRYPIWHSQLFKMTNCRMNETCRAAIWYSSDGIVTDSVLGGAKCFRECDNITIKNCKAKSSEFGWKCRKFEIDGLEIESEYMFLESKDLNVNNLQNTGKYSFQYTQNVHIKNSTIRTKDALWHTKNTLVEDSTIESEYLAWYSDGLTLRNCVIIGAQPLCYCKNLKLENCKLVNCNLAFEYSDVNAEIDGEVLSVKNPRSGMIVADKIGEIVRGNEVYPCDCKIIERNT